MLDQTFLLPEIVAVYLVHMQKRIHNGTLNPEAQIIEAPRIAYDATLFCFIPQTLDWHD